MFLLVTFGQKKWLDARKHWFHDELVKLTDKWWCNKSEVSWQKLPPYKICWPTWSFLSWSQMTKNAEKLRVANFSGWHHSGAVWWGSIIEEWWKEEFCLFLAFSSVSVSDVTERGWYEVQLLRNDEKGSALFSWPSLHCNLLGAQPGKVSLDFIIVLIRS